MKLTDKQYLLIGLGAAALIGGSILLLKKPSNSFDSKSDLEEKDNSIVGTSENTTVVLPKQNVNTLIKNGKTIETIGTNVNIRKNASATSSIITKISGLIGVVNSYALGSDGYYWYKVTLAKPIGSLVSTLPLITVGYVRSDLVKEYKLINYTGL